MHFSLTGVKIACLSVYTTVNCIYTDMYVGMSIYIQVVTNGLIEFGTTLYETISEIPQSDVFSHFVAPFATEIFYDNNQEVRYDTFLNGDSEMVAVSSFLRALLGSSGFNGQWMLVVDWHNVHSSNLFVSI